MTSGFERSQEKLFLFCTLFECPQGSPWPVWIGPRIRAPESIFSGWGDRSISRLIRGCGTNLAGPSEL
jgi:hypothetical protein